MYLILSRDLYFNPNRSGYTGIKDKAGRYTEEEAKSYGELKPYNSKEHDLYYIHEDDAPDYTVACYWDLKLVHQKEKLEEEVIKLRKENANLHELLKKEIMVHL